MCFSKPVIHSPISGCRDVSNILAVRVTRGEMLIERGEIMINQIYVLNMQRRKDVQEIEGVTVNSNM